MKSMIKMTLKNEFYNQIAKKGVTLKQNEIIVLDEINELIFSLLDVISYELSKIREEINDFKSLQHWHQDAKKPQESESKEKTEENCSESTSDDLYDSDDGKDFFDVLNIMKEQYYSKNCKECNKEKCIVKGFIKFFKKNEAL